MQAEIAAKLGELCERMKTLEGTVQKLVSQTMTKEERNALRRQYYRQRREAELKDRLILPDSHILHYRDNRLEPFAAKWAAVGMKFGAADRPQAFLTWLTHEWNSCTYLKKPITFSGSSFRVWTGHLRHPYGAGDLMHYYQKRKKVFLRSQADYQDFQGRPWWGWALKVLMPVYEEMEEMGWDDLPERFRRCFCILLGGYTELKVLADGPLWDPNAGFDEVNRMLKRIGPEYVGMLRACFIGLKVSPCQVQVPE